jgi:hypothetical protein
MPEEEVTRKLSRAQKGISQEYYGLRKVFRRSGYGFRYTRSGAQDKGQKPGKNCCADPVLHEKLCVFPAVPQRSLPLNVPDFYMLIKSYTFDALWAGSSAVLKI